CFAKRSNQEKATPEIAPRCAGSPCRRCPERGAAKLATLRFAQTDAAPFPAPGIAVTAQSTGLKATATATTTAKAKAKAKTLHLHLHLHLHRNSIRGLNNASRKSCKGSP
ncbi:hypothetical protein, partial [Noviherbaspirillum pedocola]|uniref:hypothetical protein n=1 Tax=Noviherbaspirillum pedocola TaxID=2801341 RepID=UPI001F1C1D65